MYFSRIASTRAAPSCSGRLLLILLKLLARWLIIQRLLVSLAARVVLRVCLLGILLWGGSLGRRRLLEVRVLLLCDGGCLRLAII
jgi:hypothetical protein